MRNSERVTVDGYSGTVRDLLRLLRDLHVGTGKPATGTRIEAIQATCEEIAAARGVML